MNTNQPRKQWGIGQPWALLVATALGTVAGHGLSGGHQFPPGPPPASNGATLVPTTAVVTGSTAAQRPPSIPPPEGMPGPDLLRARATAEEDFLRRSHRWENFGVALAGLDPAGIREQLADLAPADRAAALRGLFFQLGLADPQVALATMGALALSRDDQAAALTALVDRWTLNAPFGPWRRANFLYGVSLEAGLGKELLYSDPPRLDLARLWAEQVLSPGRERADLLTGVAREMVATDPAAALAVGRDLDGQHYVRFLQGVLKQWACGDPMAASAWLDQLSDPGVRAAARGNLITGLLISGLSGSRSMVEVFDGLPPGETRAAAIPRLARMLAVTGAESARRWADTLNDPAERAVAQAAVAEETLPTAPGVGMIIDVQEGIPVVIGLLSNAPAATSGQILRGDRILAVARTDGQFVDVQGMTDEEVGDLVRGEVGSAVQLRVASPQPGGYGPSRVVSLVRAVLPRK